MALQLSVESLIRPRFQRWLRDALMQCEKSQRQRIIFELAEADVCQYIGRLQPVMRLVNALGVRVAVVQAGLTLGWNQLDQAAGCGADQTASGSGAQHRKAQREPTAGAKPRWKPVKACLCKFLRRAYAAAASGWYCPNAVSRAGRGIFAASQPLDTNVKKYSQRYSV